MRETQALIERVRRIGADWQHLELAIEPELAQIQPGQTLLARLGNRWDPYLREQWIPLGYNPDEGVLIVERPMSNDYNVGDEVSLLGPVGSPFEVRRNIRNLLLIAQDYPPTRLLALLLQAIADGLAVTLVLTGSATQYPLHNLPEAVEVIHSDDPYNWPEQERMLMWAEQVYCVAAPVYSNEVYHLLYRNAQQIRRALPEHFLYGVYALPFPCGTGACLACLVRRKGADHLACIQGPAFDLTHMSFT